MQALDQSHAAVDAGLTAEVAAVQPLRFVHRGVVRTCIQVAPDRTLLALLREDLGLTSVKEGCASGDCGACTVAVADRGPDGVLRWRALNSCIRPAHAVAGTAVWTAQDLPLDPLLGAGDRLYPVQQALVQAHGSQCGFCTPGFDELVRALPALAGSGGAVTCSHPRGPVGQSVPLHRLPAHSGRGRRHVGFA